MVVVVVSRSFEGESKMKEMIGKKKRGIEKWRKRLRGSVRYMKELKA